MCQAAFVVLACVRALRKGCCAAYRIRARAGGTSPAKSRKEGLLAQASLVAIEEDAGGSGRDREPLPQCGKILAGIRRPRGDVDERGHVLGVPDLGDDLPAKE